jgi:hypothetical protein
MLYSLSHIHFCGRRGFRTGPDPAPTRQMIDPTPNTMNPRMRLCGAAEQVSEVYRWWKRPTLSGSEQPPLSIGKCNYNHWLIHFSADTADDRAALVRFHARDVSQTDDHTVILIHSTTQTHVLVVDRTIAKYTGWTTLGADTRLIIDKHNRRVDIVYTVTALCALVGLWLSYCDDIGLMMLTGACEGAAGAMVVLLCPRRITVWE